MKTAFIFLLAVSAFVTSCEKGDGPGPELRRQTEEKLMGRWQVEKIVNQEYEPIPTLKTTNEYIGTNEDYYTFKTSNKVEISAAPNSKIEVDFEVINPNQVWIHDKAWRITEHTPTKLTLVEDRNDAVNNKRYVITIQLKR